MAYGNYNNYSYNGYPYSPMSYQQYQQPTQNVMQQQANDNPFTEAHFGTIKEAEAYVVSPLKSALFLNAPVGEIYVKSADNMGVPTLSVFKKVNSQPEPQTSQIDPNLFVKRDELKEFLTKNDLEQLKSKLDILERQLKIREIEKGVEANGKPAK